MTARPLLGVVALAVLVAACRPLADPGIESGAANLPPCQWSQVVRVTDGDTIVVQLDGREQKVRYIGMNTPEISPRQPFGPEASDRNEQLVGGKRICLERDVSETDRYGRLLRHPWLADGRLVSEELVAEGLAQVVTFPPDVKYQESRMLPAQEEARIARRGIWK